MTTLTEHSRVRFRVPGDSTAAAPPEVRGSSRDDVRMLVARPDGVQHRRFTDLAEQDRKSTRLNSSHPSKSRMPSSA